jgi:septal ring factor EnvC (AmiA/AmiB activator)
VEKDEPIGHAGYYPEAHGNGLYFELRFRQKPINPQLWLMPAQ